jgi:hypothetical protein
MKNIFLHLTFWSANYANLFNNRLTDEGSACFWPLKPETRARGAHIGFVWRPYVEFMATSFALEAGSFVRPSLDP